VTLRRLVAAGFAAARIGFTATLVGVITAGIGWVLAIAVTHSSRTSMVSRANVGPVRKNWDIVA